MKAIQIGLHNGMGEAAPYLDPLCRDAAASTLAVVLELRDQLPALSQYRLLSKILPVDAGCGAGPDGGPDFYWWL